MDSDEESDNDLGVSDVDLTKEAVSIGAAMAHKDLGHCTIKHYGMGTMYANTDRVQVEYFSVEEQRRLTRWVRRDDLRPRASTSKEGAASTASNLPSYLPPRRAQRRGTAERRGTAAQHRLGASLRMPRL
eukprot:scaffold133554_cov31-Tisochrysis_lutea.AAC.1